MEPSTEGTDSPAASGTPRVTVVIPVHNRAHYIGSAVESVLAQTFTDFEVAVIDDGSTDATPTIVRGISDPRVRLVRHERNLGIPAARNQGLDTARGFYIATLDSDDLMHPRRLERQVAFLDRHPDHAIVGTWERHLGRDGHSVVAVRRKATRAADVHAQLLFGGSVSNSTTMGRTEALRRYRYREEFVVRQDFDLFVRVAEAHCIANLPEVLTIRRRHVGQITEDRKERIAERSKAIIGYQLERLGVRFTQEDLARHYALPRLGKRKLVNQGIGVAPDRALLDWAEGWLSGLIEANRRTARYDALALGRLAGWLWVRTSWRVARAEGGPTWRGFARSPLTRLAVPGLRSRIGRILPAVAP